MESVESALIPKKIRLNLNVKEESSIRTCQHYVKRKKRSCKMVVAKGKSYCGEHEPINEDKVGELGDCRIVCPLDDKHTVYRKNLQKHLKICNARAKESLPLYIQVGVNDGVSSIEDNDSSSLNFEQKLSEISEESILLLLPKIEYIYKAYVDGKIEKRTFKHKILSNELNHSNYGKETIKHLSQTSSLLGYLEESTLLKDETSFIEFGAGKGQVSYWLSKIIENQANSLSKTNVILIDRASLRHKKDNKIENRSKIHRIRADIRDVILEKIEVLKDMKHIVAIGKHLCGSATDLMLRCLLHHNTEQDINFIVSLCCHHKCMWKSFVGKEFLKSNGINYNQFILMTKMVSWAVCGNGMSRNKKKHLELAEEDKIVVKENACISKEKRKEIGQKCKRILDFARVSHMRSQGYECNLNFYVSEETTLENVCLFGVKSKPQHL